MVKWIGCPVIDIKTDMKVCKILLHRLMILVDDCLCCCSLLHRLNGYGGAVFIASAHKNNITLLGAQVSGVDVCRDISTCKVTNMFETVGIRQG